MRASSVVKRQWMGAPRMLRCCSQAETSRRMVPRSGRRAGQTLAAERAQFDLGDVEPTAVLGRVMDFQAVGQPGGPRRAERFRRARRGRGC